MGRESWTRLLDLGRSRFGGFGVDGSRLQMKGREQSTSAYEVQSSSLSAGVGVEDRKEGREGGRRNRSELEIPPPSLLRALLSFLLRIILQTRLPGKDTALLNMPPVERPSHPSCFEATNERKGTSLYSLSFQPTLLPTSFPSHLQKTLRSSP